MNEISQAIIKVKSAVSEREWQSKIEACRRSGLNAKEWCAQNGVTPGQYYYHLRKIRESLVEDQKIVPIPAPVSKPCQSITVRSGSLTVTVSEDIPQEHLLKVFNCLRKC